MYVGQESTIKMEAPKMNCVVSFMGPSGSGKTTLAKIVEESMAMIMLPSATALVKKSFPNMTYSQLLLDRKKYAQHQHSVVQAMVNLAEQHVGVDYVADRGVPDALAYTMALSSARIDEVWNEKVQAYFQMIRERQAAGRQVVFLCRGNSALSDATRQSRPADTAIFLEPELQIQVEASIETILQIQGIKYVPITETNMADRNRIVSEVLRACDWLNRGMRLTLGGMSASKVNNGPSVKFDYVSCRPSRNEASPLPENEVIQLPGQAFKGEGDESAVAGANASVEQFKKVLRETE